MVSAILCKRKSAKKITFFARQFYTLFFSLKFSNLRPLFPFTFPQGFQTSKFVGHPTSRSVDKKMFKRYHTDTRTDGQTNRPLDWSGPEGQFNENSGLEILNYFNFLDWITFICHSVDLLSILSQILTSSAVCSCVQAKYNLSTLASVFVCGCLPNDFQLWGVSGVWCLVQSANVQVGYLPGLGPRGALDYLLITWWPLMIGLPLSTILPTTVLKVCAKA